MPIPQKDFFFLRHGQTEWNAQGRFQGHSDIPLNASGLAQAESAAQLLAPHDIDIVAASPLLRARQTANIVGAKLGKAPLFDDDLKERHFGRFEGLVVNQVKASLGLQPHERLKQHLPDDAEQWHDTTARTARVIGKWLDRHPNETILFVSHSGLFDALYEMIFGQRIEPMHAPYRWSYSNSSWTCEAV